jgi:hypothetical protein
MLLARISREQRSFYRRISEQVRAAETGIHLAVFGMYLGPCTVPQT